MDTFQIIISITAISFAVLYPLYSLCKRERTLTDYVLFAALICTAALELFDLLAIIQQEKILFWKQLALIAEGCLPPTWLLFTLIFSRQDEIRSISLIQRILLAFSGLFVIALIFLPSDSLFYSPDFKLERVLFLGDSGFIFYIALMVYMIIALKNLEITLANASRSTRGKIKFEVLGAGSMLVSLIFYYSQGFLYRTINMNLIPVRTVALLLAVILIAYSQLRRSDGAKIQVSRKLAYKSLVLLAVGLYLIVLGLAGEGMRYFGESFQRSLGIALALAAGIGFISVLLSERAKRKIKDFLNRNFYQDKYDYRVQWLEFTDRLSSARSGDELLTDILSGYCETFGMGCGALYLSDKAQDGFSIAAKLEMEPQHVSVNCKDPFIEYILGSKQVVNMRQIAPELELGKDAFWADGDLSFAIPLFLNDSMHGFILLARPLNSSETYSSEDYDLMKTLAHQTSSAISNLRLADQLAQAKEMEVLGKISAFVVHDLKNLVYTLSLILDNARDYITEPEFQQDMLASLGNTVGKMKTLISKLKYLPEKSGLQKEHMDLLQLIKETAALITGVEVKVDGISIIALIDRDEMQKVALNLLVNAVDATDGKGPVEVSVGGHKQAFFRVTDGGCGIPEEFVRRHLFTPFHSTKKSGLGIGLYQCRQIVEAHNGKIEAESKEGYGSSFTVWLPLEQ